MKKTLLILGCVASAVQMALPAESGSLLMDCCADPSSIDSAFQKDKWEIGVNSGVMSSPFITNVQKHAVNYATMAIQAGYMFGTPGGSGWYRGNFEMLAEMFGGAVFQGKGSYLGGGTLWFRYNFVPERWRVKPFTGIGIGAESTDIDRSILGQDINFNLDASIGLRYMVSSHCSLNLEWRYQHFSDAGMSKVNRGINAQGVVLGVSWLF